jgi:hypothetical protein
MRVLDALLLSGAVLLRRHGMPPEASAPAAIAEFVRVDEIVRRLTAFGAFERHGPRYSASVQAIYTGAHLNPLAELGCCIPFVQFAGLLTCEKKRPRPKQSHQACRRYERHEEYDHMTIPPASNISYGLNSSVSPPRRSSRSSNLDAYRLLAGIRMLANRQELSCPK